MEQLLFTPIHGPDRALAKRLMTEAVGKVDGVELRFDTFSGLSFEEMGDWLAAARAHFRTLVTVRPVRQGGLFLGSEEERLSLVERLCTLGPDFVDLEYDVPRAYREELWIRFPKIRFVCSYHNFEETPQDLAALFEQMLSLPSQIYKIATMAQSSVDGLRLLEFLKENSAKHALCVIGMGEQGQVTRILGQMCGNSFSFVAIDPVAQIAPGQMLLEELTATYRYRNLNMHTKLFSLIGNPIEKSAGALLHNAVFEQLNINACYVKMAALHSDLHALLHHMKRLPFIGLSVTVPLKSVILPYLDWISPEAYQIGAVNTIRFDGEVVKGWNTDGAGALNALGKHTRVQGKKIVLVGAGATAKAIAYEALQRGAHVTVINRTKEHARDMAERLHCERGGGLELFPEIFREGYDILIQCTPSGDWIDPKWILPNAYVMEVVYRPKMTAFLQHAADKGCKIIFGVEMFLEQAVLQQAIWQGEKTQPDLHEVMRLELVRIKL